MNRYITRTLPVVWWTLLLLWICPLALQAQSAYPVHVTVQTLSPYGLYLSDYYSGSRDRLVVTLLNRDKDQRTLQVKLRVQIKNGASFQLHSRDELYYPIITLESGVPFRLTGADLAHYLASDKIQVQGYLKEGKLPTGMTEFSVQAVDYTTGRVLSDYGTGRAWLEIKQPPMLNLPGRDEQLSWSTPQQIRFQWMPRHQGLASTQYEFVLKELPNNGADPQSSYAYGYEIYRTETRFTTFNYTHLQPLLLPGKRYGWQVRAIAKDGADEIGMFENNGYSEINWFELNDNCPAPLRVEAKGGYRKMTLEWQTLPEQQAFVVEYRPKSEHSLYEWTAVRTSDHTFTAYQLSPGWQYEYRVGALCMTDKPVYSPVGEITLSEDNEERLVQCGIKPTIDLANQTPKEDLKTGDVVIVGGDFPMKLIEVSAQGSGWYSGKGALTLPWILEIDVAVKFNRLRVNTDNRQIDGEVETETDPDASQIGNLNEADYGGSSTTPAKLIFVTTKVDFTVPEIPSGEYDPESDELIVFDTEGEPHVIDVPKNDGKSVFPIIIEDAEGNKYQIDLPADTSTSQEGAEENGTDTSGGKQKPIITKVDDLPSGFTPGKYAASEAGFSVRFAKGNGVYAFDSGKEAWYQTAQLIKSYYPQLAEDYVAPWKLIPVGSSDVVEASISGDAADKSTVRFVLKDGSPVPFKEVNGKWQLTLPSVKSGETYEVFAVSEKKKGKVLTVGKLNVVSYPSQTRTVTLVPVSGEQPDVAFIERDLNRLYRPYGISITVKVDDCLKGSTAWDGALNLNGSGFFSKETDEMKALRKLYQSTSRNYDRNSYYIFLLDRAKAGDEPDAGLAVQGDMPRGKQFGYIFLRSAANTARLIAHELGHGIFTLRHSFDVNYSGDKFKAATSNLMDYNNGEDLAVWQWNVLAHPAPLTWFDSDDDSKAVLEPAAKAIARLIRSLNCALSRKDKQVRLFVPNISLIAKISSLVNELNLAGSNCPDAELKVTLQDNYGEVKDYGNDYLGDEFNLSTIQYEENKAIILKGKKYQLYISSSKDVVCIYSFVKNALTEQMVSSTPVNLASLDELQYASLCELEQLKIENRLELLKKVSQETNWYNGSLKDSRQKISIQLLTSTPVAQQAKLLFFLHTNPIVVHTLYDVVDDYRNELVDALLYLFVKNQQALKDLKTVSLSLRPGIVEQSKKELSDYVFGWLYTVKQQTTAEFVASQRIEVKSKQYRGMSLALEGILKEGVKQFEGRPFDVIRMIDPKDATCIDLPLILYKYAADESLKETILKDFVAVGKESLDIALLCTGLKNLTGISTALKTEVTMQNVARLILGSADLLTLGLGNVCENSNSEFCKAYKEYELLINCGLLSVNVLNEFPKLYNGLEKGLDNSLLNRTQRQKLKEILGESKIVKTFTTNIDDKIKVIGKETLFGNQATTFFNSEYVTAELVEDIVVYRRFGGDAKVGGDFVSTVEKLSRDELALVKSFNNSMRFEVKIRIPKGEKINIGKVGPWPIKAPEFMGGADQIILRHRYPINLWAINIKDLKTGKIYTYGSFKDAFPIFCRDY